MPRILLFLAVLTILLVPTLASPVHQAHAASSPDLTVDNIWLEESSNPGQPVTQVNPGDQFLIVASMKNLGTATASGYYLDVYYDNDYGRGGPDTIAPGEAQVWYIGPLTAQAGTHTTKWVVDPDNQIAELDESNNEKDYTFTIGAQTTTTTSTSNSTTVLTTQTTQTSTNTTTSTTTTSTSTTTTTSSTSTTSSPATVSIILTANPLGSIVVDGTTYTSQQTFTWIPGSSHTVTANSPVPGDSGTQYVWASWADGGNQSRTIMAPSSPTTYTANYQTQYQVTYSPTGCSIPVSLPASEWVSAGASSVGVFPATVASSDGKTQCVLQSANDAGPINAPTMRAGTYKTQWQVTFAANPSGAGAMTVNGQPSGTAWYDDGVAFSIQAIGNTGYAFSSWNTDATSITFGDPSAQSTTVAIRGAGTITAGFHLPDTTPPVVTSSASPGANGNGWNNGPVTVTWSVSDPESGIASSNGCNTTTLSTETGQQGTTLTCSVTNGAGLSSSASVTVRIDLTAPTLSLPQSVVVDPGSSSGTAVSYNPSGSDSLSGLDKLSCTPPSGSTFPAGNTAVSCSATDKAGNAATGTFAVTVQDKTPPVLIVPGDITVEATGPKGAVVTFTVSALDSVDGSLTPTCTPSPGSTFALGSTAVSCSVKDKAGNPASASFKVNVADKTPPTITVPADMTVPATGASGAVVKFTVSASDLVDGSVAVTCTPASGSTFPLGTTTVSCSAKDKAGNVASASFKVTVPAVTVTLLSSDGKGLGGAVVQYYSGGWKSFGTTTSDGTARMALPPGTYTFQITYAGASQQKSQNVGTNPNVVFQTTLVTVKLLSSTNTELSGAAQYYSGGWKTFGAGATTTTMQLLPLTYTFQISYAGASQQISQNTATNPNVIFKTVQVHSDSGKCTSYYAGGWRTFTQDMQLLPGAYTFRFNDKTRDTSYTLLVGALKHIH